MTRPPLRWVGGKQRYGRVIAEYITAFDLTGVRYFEPFVGGGSVFFRVSPRNAVLGDANHDLINFYRYLATSPETLRQSIDNYGHVDSHRAYLNVRNEFNSADDTFHRAVLFFILNRTGFNGIWRVNRLGNYNVPFGHRGVTLIDLDSWLALARSLNGAVLMADDYRRTLVRVTAGDVVYLDPPYFDSTGREMFARYTHRGFSQLDHECLAEEFGRLSKAGARVIMSVRDDPFIRKLYGSYVVETVGVSNCVGARGGHVRVSDLLVRNFG